MREGNMFKKVRIFRYLTKNTFDSYSWQVLENKQKIISQIMTGKSPARSVEDIDQSVLKYSEVKALTTGNPFIKEKMELDVEIARLMLYKNTFNNQKYHLEDDINYNFPKRIKYLQTLISGYQEDIQTYAANRMTDDFRIQIQGTEYVNRKEAASRIVALINGWLKENAEFSEPTVIGEYMGFQLKVEQGIASFSFILCGALSHEVEFSSTVLGTLTRLKNKLDNLSEELAEKKQALTYQLQQFENAKIEVAKPFPKEAELRKKQARLVELNNQLNISTKAVV